MRLEELVLDGFKSYPVRTTISGFDPSFNAVTCVGSWSVKVMKKGFDGLTWMMCDAVD